MPLFRRNKGADGQLTGPPGPIAWLLSFAPTRLRHASGSETPPPDRVPRGPNLPERHIVEPLHEPHTVTEPDPLPERPLPEEVEEPARPSGRL